MRLHHVGFVVASIESSVEGFLRSLGARWDGKVFHDSLQGVRVTFLDVGCAGSARIELVEPAGGGAPVGRFLSAGGGLHHLCYEVDDIDAQIKLMRARHVTLAKPPLPAVAFDNRRIAWMATRERLLLEFVESAQR